MSGKLHAVPIGRPRAMGSATALALACTALLAGCAGSKAYVTFEEAEYPISMSSWVPNEYDRAVSGESLETVGRFEATRRGWSLFYSALPLNRVDFSEELNRQVEEAGGEAIVNLELTSALPFWPDVLPNYLFLHWIPIWPGSIRVTATGDIVRRSGSGVKSTVARPATE